MEKILSTAATKGGGLTLASFGSGEPTGSSRLSARARGPRRNQNASAAETRAARAQINRSNLSRAAKRRLLDEIQLNARRNGVRRGVLSDIMEDFRDML